MCFPVSVVCEGVYVDLLFFLVIVDMCGKRTHASLFEVEVLNCEVGICIGLAESGLYVRFSRSVPTEADSIEFDKVEDVVYIDVAEVDKERVFECVVSFSVDDNMLLVVPDGKIVECEVFIAIADVGGFNSPDGIVDENV